MNVNNYCLDFFLKKEKKRGNFSLLELSKIEM